MSTQFADFKEKAIEDEPHFYETTMGDIQIESLESLKIEGKRLPLSESGLESLQSLVKLPKRFSNKLSRYISEDAPAEVMDAFRSGISSSEDGKDLFVKIDPSENKIVDVSKTYSRVTREGFFDLVKRIIENYNLSVTGTSLDENGTIRIQTEKKGRVHNFDKYEDEAFRCGPSFVSDYGLLEIHNYVTRLVCTNGMVSPREDQDFRASLNREDMTEFFEYIHNLSENDFVPPQFFEQLERAKNYNASFYEMETVAENVAQFYQGVNENLPEELDEIVPYYKNREMYRDVGENPSEWSAREKHTAPTSMNYWELVNAFTKFASHDYSGFEFSDSESDEMISKAGEMLASNPDEMDVVTNVPDFQKN